MRNTVEWCAELERRVTNLELQNLVFGPRQETAEERIVKVNRLTAMLLAACEKIKEKEEGQ